MSRQRERKGTEKKEGEERKGKGMIEEERKKVKEKKGDKEIREERT